MKKFSTNWKRSTIPKKQRSYFRNAPLHIKSKFLAANLSKELRKKYLTRSMQLRKGDKVRVVRGQFRGTIGKVNRADIKKNRVYVDKVEQKKADGSSAPYPIHPSKLMIIELNLEDKRRIKEKKKEKK